MPLVHTCFRINTFVYLPITDDKAENQQLIKSQTRYLAKANKQSTNPLATFNKHNNELIAETA